jgi:LDH2 family malate/lactate/ureidoglycolate dehydrogenase
MLPDPWILDAQGNPSRKPADLDAGGCVRPMGEHKGYALAVMIDILSALMAGGLPSLSVHNQRCAPEAPTGASQSFHAIDPERFAGRAFLEGAIDAYRNALREALPSDPRLPVLAPGDPEIELTRIARMEGIPVAGHIVEAMDAVADDLGQPIFSDSCEKCETWQ